MVVKTPTVFDLETLAELHARLGFVPLSRIPLKPAVGTATEADVIRFADAEQKRLYELVDGTLVEKAMGTFEGILAAAIITRLGPHVEQHRLGLVNGADGPYRMLFGNVRYPDVSFIPWSELPGGELPNEKIWSVVPHLAIEVLSESNTVAEITRKIGELFTRGTKLIWIIDPVTRSAKAYTSSRRSRKVGVGGVLDGGKVVPGFQLRLSDLFAAVTPPRKA